MRAINYAINIEILYINRSNRNQNNQWFRLILNVLQGKSTRGRLIEIMNFFKNMSPNFTILRCLLSRLKWRRGLKSSDLRNCTRIPWNVFDTQIMSREVSTLSTSCLPCHTFYIGPLKILELILMFTVIRSY